jgi:hypothetical protein
MLSNKTGKQANQDKEKPRPFSEITPKSLPAQKYKFELKFAGFF